MTADDDADPSSGNDTNSAAGRGTAPDEAVELWALPRPVQVLRWAGCLGLVIIIGHSVQTAIHDRPDHPAVGAGVIALLVLVRMLRAVVAVCLDPSSRTVTLFRTVGPALQTRPDHIRRLDRGLLEQHTGTLWTRANRARPPAVRIVTDEGTATLSVFFAEDTELDLAATLLDHHPDHLRVEL